MFAKFLGNLCEKICYGDISKIAQSCHTENNQNVAML